MYLPVYQQPNLVYMLVQLRLIRLVLWELWRITRLLAVLRSIQLPVCCQPVVLHVCVQLGLLLQRIAGLLALFWRRMHLSMHEQPDLVHVLLQQRLVRILLQRLQCFTRVFTLIGSLQLPMLLQPVSVYLRLQLGLHGRRQAERGCEAWLYMP